MSQRKLEYLHRRRIIYRRGPITDTPSETFSWGNFYKDGTYECYELFRSKAKITSYKSFKWHILVLWYLNKKLTYDDILELTYYLADKDNGFVTIKLNKITIKNLVNEVFEQDLDTPPKNKMRKIIFKESSGLTTIEKLKIVGGIIGKTKKAEPPDIYEAMLSIHDNNAKITISKILVVESEFKSAQ